MIHAVHHHRDYLLPSRAVSSHAATIHDPPPHVSSSSPTAGGFGGEIQNPADAVAFSASGRHQAALPIVSVISSPATCAANPVHRAGMACLHSLPFNSAFGQARVSLRDEAARAGHTHVPQVRWLEQFTHEKNLLLL